MTLTAAPAPESFRLLIDGPADGPTNMGTDEALLATAQQSGLATLRFYSWASPWLSLGYGQRRSEDELARLRAAGVGWVRRVTGGRAVLHGEDLTYAIASPVGRLPASLRGSYSLVADALSAAFSELGIEATRSLPKLRSVGPSPAFDCFAEPAADEFCIRGRKFCGSAQRRAQGALLQHGSIRLNPDHPAARAAAMRGPEALANGEAEGEGESGTCLADEGIRVDPERLIEAISTALAERIGTALVPGSLSADERAEAARRRLEPSHR